MKKNAIAAIAMAWSLAVGASWAATREPSYAARLPQDETIYFVMVDRFANGDPTNDTAHTPGGPLVNGFDPTRSKFYQGGDLKGLTDKLPYIQHLGATAIWVSPIFRNQWLQGPPGHQSAAYHGYWITDFTDVDPHFGTKADFKRLVQAAHARGMKVYLDIVINHTADIIRYRECPQSPCAYRSEADYPYDRRGGVNGPPINPGFLGDDEAHQTDANFSKLVSPDYAYTPYLPPGAEHVKKPDWLNDIRLYHNRGDMGDIGHEENKTHGDFGGLDDVMTENPRVLRGFIAIYEQWIADFGIDGYRIDTERHVNASFWRVFCPAILEFARTHGKPNFHIFGEVANPDPAYLAKHTRVDKLPAVLDFAFQAAALDAIGGTTGTMRLARLFDADPDYAGGAEGAMHNATFLGNHDMGRFADLLRQRSPHMSRDELLRRTILGHALLLFSRGAPVIYYGAEQGLYGGANGGGGDDKARQTMFPSRVAVYEDETPLGAAHPGAPGYNEQAPIYRAIAAMTALRNAHPGLRRGAQKVVLVSQTPGLYVFTRTDPNDGQYLIALNTSTEPKRAYATVDAQRSSWTSLHGTCAARAAAPGSLQIEVPPLDYIVCRAAR